MSLPFINPVSAGAPAPVSPSPAAFAAAACGMPSAAPEPFTPYRMHGFFSGPYGFRPSGSLPGAMLYPPFPETAGDIVGRAFAPAVDSILDGFSELRRWIEDFFGASGRPANAAVQSGLNLAGAGGGVQQTIGAGIATAAVASMLVAGCGMDESTQQVFRNAVIEALGGLGLFLFGMEFMGNELKAVSGPSLKRLMAKITGNRFAATAVGALVTGTIQSSSVTTVLTVGLVDAGIMTLAQALGVNFGANIGTTVTAWLFTCKITEYALPMIFAAMFPALFSSNENAKKIGSAVFGLGLVFLGLTTMSAGFHDPAIRQYLREFLSGFSSGTYGDILKGIMASAAVTGVIQSSSATVGITIALAKSGIIPFETAAAFVLGANIGTTVTAVLAAIRPGVTTEARQVALGNLLFNFIGVLLVFPFSPQAIEFMKGLMEKFGVDAPDAQVAFTHTFFNVMATAFFLSCMRPFETAVVKTSSASTRLGHALARFFPSGTGKKREGPRALSDLLLGTSGFAVEASQKAVGDMREHVERMFTELLRVLRANGSAKGGNGGAAGSVAMHEALLDVAKASINEYVIKLTEGRLSHDDALRVSSLRAVAEQMEKVGDRLFDILRDSMRLEGLGIAMPETVSADVYGIHEKAFDFFRRVGAVVSSRDLIKIEEVRRESLELKRAIDGAIAGHQGRIEANPESPEMHASSNVLAMLSAYRNIVGHAVNVAEALTGGKKPAPHTLGADGA